MSLPLNLSDTRGKRQNMSGTRENSPVDPQLLNIPSRYYPCPIICDPIYQPVPSPSYSPLFPDFQYGDQISLNYHQNQLAPCHHCHNNHVASPYLFSNQQYHPSFQNLTLDQFELFNTLGTGTFGRVYLCRFRQPFSPPISPAADMLYSPNGRQCSSSEYRFQHQVITDSSFFALKMMSKREVLRLKQLEHVFSEKTILLSCSHPFIIHLHSTFQNQKYLFMLLEYGSGGELFSYLKKYGRFSLPVTRFYAAELVLALEYLHSRNIVFRDLKPENLLLDALGHIKIADFGFAKALFESMTWTLCGTPEYLAPEIIQGQGHSKEVDWWALGILIYEMLVGFPPFYDSNPFQIYEKILLGNIAFPEWIDLDTRLFISHLLNADRKERLGSSLSTGGSNDVKKHPWFTGVDWNAIYWRRIPPPIRPALSFPGDSANFERYPEIRPEPIPSWEVDPYQHLFDGF